MKDKNKVLAKVVCAVMSMMLVTGAAACDSEKDKNLDFGNQGIYYTEIDGQEYRFTINDKTFELVIDGETLEGNYTFDGEKINLTFDGSKGTGTATYADGVLTVDYDGKQYVMVRKTAYTVTFKTNGGSSVESQTVYNGKTATKPQDPEKEGCTFVGWYKDADFTQPFDFEKQIIAEDTTVYAYFVENSVSGEEFDVKFELGYEGEALASVKTIGGKLLNLPEPTREGYTFIGWWLSDFEDAEKLTCQYNDQQLLRATTLYAVWSGEGVAVSVTEDKISWNSKGVNVSYTVKVFDSEDKELFTKTLGATSLAYDFGSLASGEYKVTVTARGTTSEAYYLNKALAAVTHFEVQEPSLLKFNAVPFATKYLITVVCGDAGHKHVDVDLGTNTEFDFSNCEMPKEGISFVVTAVADGYASSTSEKYVYSRALAKVQGLVVNSETETVEWEEVENATSYVIEIKCDNAEHNHALENIGNVTSYSLKDCTGAITFSVYPVAKGYSSSEAETITYNKVRLSVPQNVCVEGTLLKWNAVEGAEKYEVKIGEKTYLSDKNELELSSYLTEGNDYVISVRAIAGANGTDSLYSDEYTLSYGKIGNVKYAANAVSWDYVVGATKYAVKVNDGEAVETTVNSAEIKFAKGGENTISVSYFDKDGKQSAWTDLKVTVYTMSFKSNGGKDVEDMYLANGDKVTLPVLERDGYTFAGWYDAPANGEVQGAKYTEEKFTGNQDIKLYAYWANCQYTITFEVGDEGEMEETSVVVEFNKKYTLPVPTTSDPILAFAGWYSEPNGVGTCFTDHEGISLKAWGEFSDKKLYAYFAKTLEFVEIDGGKNYSVKKSTATDKLAEITVPAVYNGKPVTVIDGGAFLSCTKLQIVNIPDSIVTVFTGIGGTEGAASCFQGCNALTEINVYDAKTYPGAAEILGGYQVYYESSDGVLIYNNPYTGKEINFYPASKTGEFDIPYGVQILPTNIFKSSKFTKITVPATVVSIEKDAFRSCTKLTEIVFLPEEEGVDEKPLTIGTTAFYYCSSLESITFPKRLSSLHRDAKTYDIDVFNSCSKLMEINVDGEGGYYTSIDGVLCVNTGSGKSIVFYPRGLTGEYTIPVTVNEVGEGAFKSCKIEKLIVPGYVSKISKNAFYGCSSLTEIEFQGKHNDVDLTIEESAFYSCSYLTEVTLPANLKHLKAHAFGSTSRLKTVTVNCVGDLDFESYAFHTSVTGTSGGTAYIETLYIGPEVGLVDINGIFGGSYLKSVIVDDRSQIYQSDNGVVYDKNVTIIVYYPKGKAGNYQIPNTVKAIGTAVFKGATELESVFINKNIYSIGDEAFSGCNKLTSVIFEEGGKADLTIGDNAFYNCRLLTSVKLPVRTVSLGANAFYFCSNVNELVLPEGLKTIGDKAFYYCSNLSTITIPSTVESMDMSEATENSKKIVRLRAFEYCSKLEEIIVAEGNEHYASINGVLYGKTDGVVTDLLVCPKLYEGVFDAPKTVNKIWTRAFYQVLGLTEVKFSEGIVGELEMGDDVFYGCTDLKKISLPQGLKTIGANMFQNCTYVEEIVIPNTVESIGVNAFYNCQNLSKIIFEEGGTAPLVLEDGKPDSSYSSSTVSTYNGVFVNCPALKSIVLPERTTKIGAYAFAARSVSSNSSVLNPTVSGICAIEEIVIPANVTEIGTYAFMHTKSLRKVTFLGKVGANGETLPRDALTLASSAFSGSGLVEITLPEGIETLAHTFSYCTNLEKANIPASVKTLSYTFYYCPALKEVNITNTADNESQLETLDYAVFYNCSSLKSFIVPKNVKSINNTVFSGCTSLTSVTFEEGSKLEEIKNNVFKDTALTSFSFPTTDGIIKLGTNLFQGCTQLTDVFISKSIASIDNVFAKCSSIKRIVVDEDNQNFKAIEKLIVNRNNDTIHLIVGAIDKGEYRIPDSYETIANRAFEGQVYITKLIIPKTVRSIGERAFANCVGLEEVVFEEGSRLTEVGAYSFESCQSLKKIELPEGLTYVSKYMFRGCASLEEVKLPESIIVVGGTHNATKNTYTTEGYAFSGCSSLKTINFPENLHCIAMRSFEYCISLEEVKISDGKFENLGNYAFEGCYSLHTVEITPNLKEKCGSGLFRYCKALKNVTLPDGLTALTANMFEGCTSLETIAVPNTVNDLTATGIFKDSGLKSIDLSALTVLSSKKKLGSSMFYGCSNLESVVLPADISDLSNASLFRECTSLKSIDLSAVKTTYLGGYAFAGCTSLTDVKLPESLTYINYYGFQGCTALKTITIPSGVKWFGATGTTKPTYSTNAYTFDGCTSLEEIILPENFEIIGAYVFRDCTSLKSVNWPAKLSIIGNYSFQNSGLEGELNIPKSVEKIGNSAFQNTLITKVDIAGKLSFTGTSMFRDCKLLTEATLNSSQATISSYMFQDCENLQSFTFPTSLSATGIGSGAFRNTALVSVTIPKNITSMGTSATSDVYTFADCRNLEEVKFEEGSKLEKMAGRVFMNCTKLDTIVLPSKLTLIGQYAFQNTSLTEVTIPKTVTTIGSAPFAYCEKMTAINVEDGNTVFESRDGVLYNKEKKSLVEYPAGKKDEYVVKKDEGVEKNAFNGTMKVNELVISDDVTEITEYMFYGLESIDTIVIPKSVTKIGNYAFAYSSIKNVTIEGTPEFGTNVFRDSKVEKVDFNDETTTLGTYMFLNCANLKTITLPSKLTAISYSCFQNSGLESITIPATVEEISTYAFSGCKGITQIEIPASVKEIGNSAFRESGLLSVVVPATVEEIGSSVFALTPLTTAEVQSAVMGTYMFNDSSIENVVLSDDITEITTYAFDGCANLKSIQLPSKLVSIGGYAFSESGLESIETPETLETIGIGAFKGCTSLKRAVLKGQLATLSNYLFSGCTNLESVELPESLGTIGTSATAKTYVFENCLKLKEIHFYGNVAFYGQFIFANWTEDQTVYVHDSDGQLFASVNDWGYAFRNSSKFKLVIVYNGEEKVVE